MDNIYGYVTTKHEDPHAFGSSLGAQTCTYYAGVRQTTSNIYPEPYTPKSDLAFNLFTILKMVDVYTQWEPAEFLYKDPISMI